MSNYPKMLYREGSKIKWEGRDLDTLIVDDADEEAEAKSDGWLLSTEVHADDRADGNDIVSAVAMLDPNEDEHWTDAGLPAVKAVSELIGKDVTRAQIKAVAPDARRPE